jgi:AcrR family transcriptional regulator
MADANIGKGQQGEESSPRPRDSAASRERLLRAATELFRARGFDGTTAREIGELADVDPTMIARYFGGKAQLFLAVLRAEDPTDSLADLRDPDRLGSLLDRIERQGPGPIIQVAIRPYDDPAAQEAALAELHHRIVGPLRERFLREGDEQAELRAELLTAAFIGVILGRYSGAFGHLAEATTAELRTLLQDLLGR